MIAILNAECDDCGTALLRDGSDTYCPRCLRSVGGVGDPDVRLSTSGEEGSA